MDASFPLGLGPPWLRSGGPGLAGSSGRTCRRVPSESFTATRPPGLVTRRNSAMTRVNCASVRYWATLAYQTQVGFQTPSTAKASPSPGHGGMVVPTAISGSGETERNWKWIPTGIVMATPGSTSTISSLSCERRHIWPRPETKYQTSSTVRCAIALETACGGNVKCARLPGSWRHTGCAPRNRQERWRPGNVPSRLVAKDIELLWQLAGTATDTRQGTAVYASSADSKTVREAKRDSIPF